MSKSSTTQSNEAIISSSSSRKPTDTETSAADVHTSTNVKSTIETNPASNLSAAQYIYDSMRDTQSKSAHQMMIQSRPGLRKMEGSNTSIKGPSGLDKNMSMQSVTEKAGSNRSMMSGSGFLSMDFNFSPDDVDAHAGLFSLQNDSKRSINSSDFVKEAFLSRDVSDKQMMKHVDLPVFELASKLERITTGDDIMEENIRMSSSEWVKDFEGESSSVGPTPQDMFYESTSSIPPSSIPPLPKSPIYSATTPYSTPSSTISPVLSGDVGGVQYSSIPPLPPLSPSTTTGTESKQSSLNDSKKSTKGKKRRKREIDESHAFEPTDDDVLFGRGGYSNNHPGNIFFRNEALKLRPLYESTSKEEKYNISVILLESVKSRGGRFLEKGKDGLWHEVIGNGARRKASQALRERIKGKSASVLSSSITSAKSYDLSADEQDDISSSITSLRPAGVDLVEV